jgi:hypothetical protein
MEKLNLIKLTYNSDSTEGRGHSITIGYVRNDLVAQIIVDDPRFARFCVMGYHKPGSQNYQKRPETVMIYDSAGEFWDDHNPQAEARRRALAKLTPEDIKALGIK